MNGTNEQINQEVLSLDDIYFKDAFTKTEDKLNLEVNNADIDCITSRNNKFSLDSDGNLIVNSLTANTVNIQNILDMIYPVGSIYTSKSAENPSTLFGGTWEQIEGKFLLGCNDAYIAGTTGGEDEHILTIAEMPTHRHSVRTNQTRGGVYAATQFTTGIAYSSTDPNATVNAGGSQPHNNMPPYIAVYMWERIS